MFKKSFILAILFFALLISIFSVGVSADNGIPEPFCGNGILETGEQCDDDNIINGDGCSSTCQIDIAPVCSVDSVKNVLSNIEYFFLTGKAYISEVGKFSIYGSAFDRDSNIMNVQYSRDGPDNGNDFIFPSNAQDAIPLGDGTFDDQNEIWTSDPADPALVEGDYRVCCKATDGVIGGISCQDFCIDTQEPNAITNLMTSVQDCSTDGDYSNSQCVTWTWDSAVDNGCSGTNNYNVELFDSSGNLIRNTPTDGTTAEFCGLVDGSYHIVVTPFDNAGNEGASATSSDVIVDLTEPEVKITNTNEDIFVSGNLEITEKDTDNNLLKCFYKVNVVNGDTTIDWTETPCNAPFTIDTISACPVDGVNKCRISKMAQDKACNEQERSKFFDIDNNSPELKKTIVEGPSFNNEEFVTTETIFEISAMETESGLKELCYQINDKLPVCVQAEGLQTELSARVNFEEESEHTLTFWATDNLNHETRMSQTHFVEEMLSVTTKEYVNLLQEVKDWVTENFEIEDFTFDWLGLNSKIMLTAEDQEPHPSGVDETLFKIFELSDNNEADIEWYGTITQKWYDDLEICEDENPEVTLIEEILNDNCIEVSGWFDENGWQEYNPETKIMLNEENDGVHKICFKSIDNLGNEEEQQCQVFFVDNTAPGIRVFNPDEEEAGNVQACYQSIVAIVEDEESGIKRVWAELLDENEELVRTVEMSLRNDGYYEALMDKQLPAGSYLMSVHAEDNVGNSNAVNIEERLEDGVFVEFLSPATCSVNTELGGSCRFTYHVCMRGANSIDFWMDKLGIPGVPPGLLEAKVSKGDDFANVGLLVDGEPNVSPLEPSNLKLDDEIINGRTTFDLNLHIPADTASQIGAGAHKLKYLVEAFD